MTDWARSGWTTRGLRNKMPVRILSMLPADTSLPVFLFLPSTQFDAGQSYSFIRRLLPRMKSVQPNKLVVFTNSKRVASLCDENQIAWEDLNSFIDDASLPTWKKSIKRAKPRFLEFNRGRPFARVVFQCAEDFTDEDFFLQLLEHFHNEQKMLKVLSVSPVSRGRMLYVSPHEIRSIPAGAGRYFFTDSKLNFATYANSLSLGSSSVSLLSKLQEDSSLSSDTRGKFMKTLVGSLSRYPNVVPELRDEEECEVYFEERRGLSEKGCNCFVFNEGSWSLVENRAFIHGCLLSPFEIRTQLDKDPVFSGKKVFISQTMPMSEGRNGGKPLLFLDRELHHRRAIRYFEIRATSLANFDGKNIISNVGRGLSCSTMGSDLLFKVDLPYEKLASHTLFLAFHSLIDHSVSKVEYLLSESGELKVKGYISIFTSDAVPTITVKPSITGIEVKLPLSDELLPGILLAQLRQPLEEPVGFARVGLDVVPLTSEIDQSQEQYALWNGELFIPSAVKEGDAWSTVSSSCR